MTLLAAIDSPCGEDAIAFELIRTLEPRLRKLDESLSILNCVTPLTDLVPALAPDRSPILVDAVVGSSMDGRVIDIDASELLENPKPASTHALSVASTLQLAQALGQLPFRLGIVGIRVDPERARTSSTAMCG